MSNHYQTHEKEEGAREGAHSEVEVPARIELA